MPPWPRPPPSISIPPLSSAASNRRWTSVFFLVLAGTYIGIGALAHGFGLGAWWLALSTVLVWAAPAQVILISALGGGAPLLEVALAVTLSAIRLFPMVVALLPLLRGEGTRLRDLAAADAFHLGQHVGGIAAAVAGRAARAAHRLLQRSVGRLHEHGGGFRLRRLSSCRRIAAAAGRRPVVPDADVVPDVDRAQRAIDGGSAGAGDRSGAWNGAGRQNRCSST